MKLRRLSSRLLATVLSVCLLAGLSVSFAAAAVPVTHALTFDGLGELILQGNVPYLLSLNTLAGKEYDRDMNLSRAFSYDRTYDDLYAAYSAALAAGNTAAATTYFNQIGSMGTSLKSANDGKETYDDAVTSQKNKVSQTLITERIAAEKLYLEYFKLLEQKKLAENKLATLNRNLATLEKKFSFGFASQAEITTMKDQIDAQVTAVDAVDKSIVTNQTSLKLSLGFAYEDKITLAAPPALDVTVIEAYSLGEDLPLYMANNQTLKDAQDAIDKQVKDKASQRALEAARLSLAQSTEKAKQSFESTFNALKDKYKTYTDQITKIDKKKTDIEKLQKQYDLGLVAKTKLTTAQDELRDLELTLATQLADLYISNQNYLNTRSGQAASSGTGGAGATGA